MTARTWLVEFLDENAGRMVLYGLADSGEEAIERAREVAIRVYEAVDPTAAKLERGGFVEFGLPAEAKLHPRVLKLARRDEPFIVIGCREPYFLKAYEMIKAHEDRQGTWTDECEEALEAAKQFVVPTRDATAPTDGQT